MKEISNLKYNWNQNDAESIKKDLIYVMRNLIYELNYQLEIFPTACNSIQFEYENENGDYLEFELVSKKTVEIFEMLNNGNEKHDSCKADSIEINKILDKFIIDNFKDDIKIQGIFAVTDEQAIDFINKLDKYNIKVPQEVQVIGFDGSKSSVNDTIKISTIRQPIELIAEKAVNSLIDIINNKNTEKEIILPITYINGSTTKR